MTLTQRIYFVHNTHSTKWATRGCRRCRRGRSALQARLPTEDHLLPEPAGKAPNRRRQVRRARAPRVGLRGHLRGSRVSPAGGPPQAAHGQVQGQRRTRL